jgi:hypothetical protein
MAESTQHHDDGMARLLAGHYEEVEMERAFRAALLERTRRVVAARSRSRLRRWGLIPARIAVSGALLLLTALGLNWFAARNGGPPTAAFGALVHAAEAAGRLETVHIKAKMRTLPHDNFDLLVPEGEFVPIQIWKRLGDPPNWRVEKPGRVVVMDGESMLMLIRPDQGPVIAIKGGKDAGFVGWLRPILDLETLLDHERQVAREQGSRVTLLQKGDPKTQPKLVLTIEARAQGDFTRSTYRRNKSVTESDNIRFYVFDARTHRLEGMKVWLKGAKVKGPVFETTRIEYDVPLDPSLFALKVPEDAIWYKRPDEMPTARDTSAMTPKEVAQALFKAMADDDWEGVRKFAGSVLDSPHVRQEFSALQVIRIGEPLRSGLYPGWFVPYEIRLKSGEVKKHNLAVRNDNPKRQWMFDGGL